MATPARGDCRPSREWNQRAHRQWDQHIGSWQPVDGSSSPGTPLLDYCADTLPMLPAARQPPAPSCHAPRPGSATAGEIGYSARCASRSIDTRGTIGPTGSRPGSSIFPPPCSAVLTTVSAGTLLAVRTNVRAGQLGVGLSACGSNRNTFDESGRFFRQKERKSLGLDPRG